MPLGSFPTSFDMDANPNPGATVSPFAGDLHIGNSLSRKKERFEPLNAPYVGMYVCGPTVYSNVHLGNVRTFLTFDVVFRYLLHLGYKVRYVRNITDVGHLTGDSDDGEDKIGKKARLENIEPMEVVQRYTNDFHDVMRVFNILPPSIEPTATGHIVEQIEMISTIIDNGYAYESIQRPVRIVPPRERGLRDAGRLGPPPHRRNPARRTPPRIGGRDPSGDPRGRGPHFAGRSPQKSGPFRLMRSAHPCVSSRPTQQILPPWA